MRLVVSLDVPTAIEARRVARLVGELGVAVRVGPRLLARVGPGVIGALRSSTDVFVDARINGGTVETVAAVRSLARVGARWVSVVAAGGRETMSRSASGASEYGADIVAVTVPPEAVGDGRGRLVSEACRGLEGTGVGGVLGTLSDIGVVAQAAGDLGVYVVGVEDPEGVAEAAGRGAAGVVVDAGIARAPDVPAAVLPYAEMATAG